MFYPISGDGTKAWAISLLVFQTLKQVGKYQIVFAKFVSLYSTLLDFGLNEKTIPS